MLSTKAGDVQLRIPKLREARSSRRCWSHAGVSTGRCWRSSWRPTCTALHPQVDDLVKAFGVDAGISKSEVSRICGELDGEVAAFRSRSLSHTGFPYVFLDATYLKARVDGGWSAGRW